VTSIAERMIQLGTLGSIDLTAEGRPGAAALLTQPKRFALLAYLAIAGSRTFVRRDTVLALFWPETDQTRGRKVLRQTVYLLRQALGSDVITNRGDEELGVDPAIVQCDVGLFESALAAGQTADALAHYRGDFLAGFHVPDAAPEFEEWMEAERRRLRALATNAAWTLALAEEQAGSGDWAVSWARRALALDPLNEKRVTDVMQLLVRVGDRAGALNTYHEYARRAEEDLGLAPNGAVQRIAQTLRTPDAGAGADPSSEASAAIALNSAEQSASLSIQVARPVAIGELPKRRRMWRRVVLASVPALAVLGLTVVLIRAVRRPTEHAVIAVGTITDVTSSEQQPSNVPADLLSSSLARLAGVQVIPLTRLYDVQSQLRAARQPASSMLAAAKQAGAEHLIEGSLHRLNAGQLRIDLQVVDARTGSVLRSHRAQGSDLFATVDEATAQIATSYGVAAPAEGSARVKTSSLIAYRLYDQGLQAYYQDDLPGAYRLFLAALAEDTTFASAAAYAGELAYQIAHLESDALLERAARLAQGATDRERLIILERVARLRMSASATAIADTMAARYPLDPDAQYALGHASVRRGDFFRGALQYRRVIAMDSLSLSRTVRCLACDAYQELWWAYMYADSAGAAERVAREFANVRPADAGPLLLLGTALARQSRHGEALSAWRTMESLRAGALNIDLTAALLAIRSGDFSGADDRLRRLLREGSTSVQRDAAWYLVLSLRNQGRLREALELTARSSPITRAIVLVDMDRPQEAARAFQAMVPALPDDAPPGHLAKHQAWLLTHVATSLAAAGDTARLALLADSVEQFGSQSAYGRDARLHHYIRGLLWNWRGQPARAAAEFRNSVYGWSEGYTRANYELARTLIAQKQPAQAVYPLQAALRGDLQSNNLYVARTELHELLAQSFDLLGQRDSAVAHYRHVINAWRSADPQFSTRVQRARLRLDANSRRVSSGSPREAELDLRP
jgi:DNA-binding SARP family transcriptional activator/TolB-like protein